MTSIERKFSTSEIPPNHRLDKWISWLSNEFQPVVIQNYDAEDFYVECEFATVGQLSISSYRGSKQTFARLDRMARSYHSDSYVAVITGPGAFQHNEREQRCNNGDVILFDATKSYQITHEPHSLVMSVTIPRPILNAEMREANLVSGLVLDCRSGAAGVIKDAVASLFRNADQLNGLTAHRISQAAVDLISAGFTEKFGLQTSQDRDRSFVHALHVRTFIDGNLDNPALDAGMIADGLGLSKRYLHAIFSREGSSIGECIVDKRLQRACRLMSADPLRQQRVASIAFKVGFVSPAHFTRRFKARFGVSPTEFREAISEKFFGDNQL